MIHDISLAAANFIFGIGRAPEWAETAFLIIATLIVVAVLGTLWVLRNRTESRLLRGFTGLLFFVLFFPMIGVGVLISMIPVVHESRFIECEYRPLTATAENATLQLNATYCRERNTLDAAWKDWILRDARMNNDASRPTVKESTVNQ